MTSTESFGVPLETHSRPFFAIALAVVATLFMAVVCGPPLNPVVSPDTREYELVSFDLGSEVARDRVPVYPLLIRLARAILGQQWPSGLMFFQIATLGVNAAILCGLFLRAGMQRWTASLFALCASATPGLVSYSRALIPEALMAMLVALAWQQTVMQCSYETHSRAGGGSRCNPRPLQRLGRPDETHLGPRRSASGGRSPHVRAWPYPFAAAPSCSSNRSARSNDPLLADLSLRSFRADEDLPFGCVRRKHGGNTTRYDSLWLRYSPLSASRVRRSH